MFADSLKNSAFLYPKRLVCKARMHSGSTRMSSIFGNFSTMGARAGCKSALNANCFTRPNCVKYSGAFSANSLTNILPTGQFRVVVNSSTSNLIISGHCFMYSMYSARLLVRFLTEILIAVTDLCTAAGLVCIVPTIVCRPRNICSPWPGSSAALPSSRSATLFRAIFLQ